MNESTELDLEAFRARLGGAKGTEYWRTLDELADREGFSEYIQQEFPRHALSLENSVDRRDFLKLMSASLALTGAVACSRPSEAIIPYVKAPEDVVPGVPLYFATAMPLSGVATGILVESHMGRPTKVEGNPEHPASLGATDSFAQASILSLYDPERSQTVRYLGNVGTWSEFLGALLLRTAKLRESGGRGLRILTQTVTSPTLGGQIQRILSKFPNAAWHQYEPAGADSVREGSRLAFGRVVNTHYNFELADVVVSLDSNFLGCGAGHVRYVRDFMKRRRGYQNGAAMNRLYVVEPMTTSTGSVADHRLPVRASDVMGIAEALAAAAGVGAASSTAAVHDEWIRAVARDLQQHPGRGIVLAGDGQPPYVHAIAHAINGSLGNVGQTVFHTEPIEFAPVAQIESLRSLVGEMNAGLVDTLLIINGNPVYDAPADFRFLDALQKVPFRAHLSSHYDETSAHSHWHIPAAHFLEMWSDARAYDGTATIIQPLIAPLYNGISPHELFAALGEDADSPYEIVRRQWRSAGGVDFEDFWRKALHDGVVSNTAFPALALNATVPQRPASMQAQDGYEIVFRPDPSVYDGTFANNGWLQELPRPITKLTWDNAALMSPTLARKLGVAVEFDGPSDVVELNVRGASVKAPVWIVPGHANDSITVHLGYGRTRAGKVGSLTGFNAYLIRPADGQSFVGGAGVSKTATKYRLACTQLHQAIDQSLAPRNLIRSASLGEYEKNPKFAHEGAHDFGDISLYPKVSYDTYAWGMVIDTGVCTGCNGCLIACQSENNISVVGKQQVLIGREMHWIRIDHYYRGDADNPEHFHQPVPCQHCENAPCEPVCPVEATTHSDEGINEMTYNRCVGTRYCANNCPYKVRRFNFYQYADYETPSLKLMRNPDVTVRSRGVMEKCSYCVQRVNETRRTAEKDNRKIREGELLTACQQACPAQAITFGDVGNPESAVSKLRKLPLHYAMLEEINTRPRTTYLATVRNPNHELVKPSPAAATHDEHGAKAE